MTNKTKNTLYIIGGIALTLGVGYFVWTRVKSKKDDSKSLEEDISEPEIIRIGNQQIVDTSSIRQRLRDLQNLEPSKPIN